MTVTIYPYVFCPAEKEMWVDATSTCDPRKNDYTIDWDTGTMTVMVNTLPQEIIAGYNYHKSLCRYKKPD